MEKGLKKKKAKKALVLVKQSASKNNFKRIKRRKLKEKKYLSGKSGLKNKS